MWFQMICNGLWYIILGFAKGGIPSRNRLLKITCAINGACWMAVGIVNIFISLDRIVFVFPAILSFLITGLLMVFQIKIDKNPISILAVIASAVLVVCAIGVIVLSEDLDDLVLGCMMQGGCMMILSMPYDLMYDKMRKHKAT